MTRHPSFLRLYLGVVGFALAAVVFAAFVSMPFTLAGHPGEPLTAQAAADRHPT